MDDDEERVRARAHEIWEREGRKEGEHERHWRQALEELKSGAASGEEAAFLGQAEAGQDGSSRVGPSGVSAEQGMAGSTDEVVIERAEQPGAKRGSGA